MGKKFSVRDRVWWQIIHHGFDGRRHFVRREKVHGVITGIDEKDNWMLIRPESHVKVSWSARKVGGKWRAFQSEGRDYLDIIHRVNQSTL